MGGMTNTVRVTPRERYLTFGELVAFVEAARKAGADAKQEIGAEADGRGRVSVVEVALPE
jgi:hypothetical protein